MLMLASLKWEERGEGGGVEGLSGWITFLTSECQLDIQV